MEKQSFELIRHSRAFGKVHSLVYSGGSRFGFFFRLHCNIRALLTLHPDIEVLHFNDALIACFYARLGMLQGRRHYVTLHGLDVVFPSVLYRRLLLRLLNRFDGLICVSRATAQQAIQAGLDEKLIHIVVNGVSADELVSPLGPSSEKTSEELKKMCSITLDGRKILFALGRPVKRKGFSWFIREVLPHLDNTTLLILAGPFHAEEKFAARLIRFLPASVSHRLSLLLALPTDQEALRSLLSDKAIRNKAIHLGRVSEAVLNELMLRCSAFVMPNIEVEGDMEGFGLVCLEASIQGAVVLASDTGGIPDAVHPGKNGILIPAGDAKAWVREIESLYAAEDQSGREAIQRYTREVFSWECMARGYHEIFFPEIDQGKSRSNSQVNSTLTGQWSESGRASSEVKNSLSMR